MVSQDAAVCRRDWIVSSGRMPASFGVAGLAGVLNKGIVSVQGVAVSGHAPLSPRSPASMAWRFSLAVATAVRMNGNRRLEWTLRSVAIFLGLLQTWATRDSLDNDVVSYLDMGDALLRGDWATGINGTWNPLYAVLLSTVLRLTGVSPAREYAVIHGVVFLIFVLTVFAFGFFLRELLSATGPAASRIGAAAVSTRTWILLGYVMFTWSALDVIGVSTTNPDMLVAACVYAATGLLLRIRRDPVRHSDFVLLGLTLGIAQLTKPFMFHGSLAFLAVATWAAFRRASLMKTAGVAAAMFLLLTAPFAAALSLQRGHLTVSEGGPVNYAWFVNKVAPRHWQGGPPSAGMPVHPTRRILESPPTYEFDRHIQVTYPAWYDPSYWYEGVRLTFQPAAELRVLLNNVVAIVGKATGPNGAFALGLLMLTALRPQWSSIREWLRANWYFAAPSGAALLLYALVMVQGRYVGAFLVVIVLGAFMAIAAGSGDEIVRLVRPFALACGILLVLPVVGWTTSPRYYTYLLHPSTSPVDPQQSQMGPSTAAPWRVAAALSALGLKPGDRVGTVQYANHADAVWARLARVEIISEVRADKPSTEAPDREFWSASAAQQEQVVEAMKREGVRAIISDYRPSGTANVTWTPLDDTGYYVDVVAGNSRAAQSREKVQASALQ